MPNRNHHILLVEDEPNLGPAIVEEFTRHGYTADLAVDGLEASAKFSSHSYSLVLLDVNLPYKDGFTLCREFREKNNKIPIIMLTATGEIQDKVEAFNIGADDYIIKPFHFVELLARVKVL